MEHPESRTASQIRTEIAKAQRAISDSWDDERLTTMKSVLRSRRDALAALKRIQAAYEWDSVKARIQSGQSR